MKRHDIYFFLLWLISIMLGCMFFGCAGTKNPLDGYKPTDRYYQVWEKQYPEGKRCKLIQIPAPQTDTVGTLELKYRKP